MDLVNLSILFLLAAIWGSSFLLMHIVAPSLGPVLTATLRVGIASLVLLLYYKWKKIDLEFKKNYKHYIIIGVINSAIPFSLYSYAALHIPTSYSVILNSTSPLFGVLFESIFLKYKITPIKIASFLIGILGVTLLSESKGIPSTKFSLDFYLSFIACLVSASLYGFMGVYIRMHSHSFNSTVLAGTTQPMASLFLIPFIYFSPMVSTPTLQVILALLLLALMCSALAYFLYFKLISDVGPSKALTVTYLMPVFGMIWGKLFLDEIITLQMMIGAFLIMIGTFLTFKKKKLLAP